MSVTPLPDRRDTDPPPFDASPQATLERMHKLEQEFDRMLNEWAQAEEDLVRAAAEVEKLKASQRLVFKHQPPARVGNKPTKEDLDALVLEWLWQEHEQDMVALINAEARVAGFKVIYKCADRSLSSKQSRLNADSELERRRR